MKFEKKTTLKCQYCYHCGSTRKFGASRINFSFQECPEGFVTILGKCYYFSEEKLEWREAQIACQELPGDYDLVSIDSPELHDALKGNTNHWIGLHDMFSEGSWTWVNGKPVKFGKTPGAYPWEDGQPDVSIS